MPLTIFYSISALLFNVKLILQVSEILRKLGYIFYHNNQSITLSGKLMFKKLAKEIGSNNPKNLDKLKWANS